MRILFYLPVITPWWFAKIVQPVIARLAHSHEVHVLAPAPWRNTGIGPDQIALCADLPDICWHIVNDAGHPSMRSEPEQRDGIIAFVRSLAPDYTICRSADFDTPRAFPGIVRHITEGAADPLKLGADCFHFTQSPFDHGTMPDLEPEQITALERLIAPYWPALAQADALGTIQQDYLNEWAGLPGNRPVLFLPLEYEHEENFYTIHRTGATPNAKLLEELAKRIGDRFFLALTNHPLNEQYLDNSAVIKVVRSNPSCMRLLPGKTPLGTRTTSFLIKAADGVILFDSKVYALAGFHAAPMLRLSRFATGGWMNAYHDLDAFFGAIERGNAAVPDPVGARRWFAYHAANNLICPRDPDLTGADLLARIDQPCDPESWARNFAYFAEEWPRVRSVLQAGAAA